MKKLISVIMICITFMFAFSACSATSGLELVKGQITAVNYEDGNKYPVYEITTDKGEKVVAKTTAETLMMSWLNEEDGQLLHAGQLIYDEIKVSVHYKESYKQDGIKTVEAYEIMIDAMLHKNVKTLADGTSVDMWQQHSSVVYQLSDGTELLRVNEPTGPDNVYSGIAESFDAFAEQAKPVVLQYYDSRGLLYDADQYLEQAYNRYKNDGENFNTYYIHQDISPSAGNENIMCFMTSLTLPHTDGYMSQEIRMGEIFDRKTGQHINGFDIFNCDEQQAMDVIVDAVFEDVNFNTSNIEDVEKFKEEIKAAVKPEYIILWSENMEISFPSGTLPNEENCYIIGIDYTDEIKAIMHPWAIPEQNRG